MIDSEYRISLDIHDSTSNVCLYCKRADTSRTIYATLTENGFPYHISEECYAVFTATKPDGNIVFNNCTIDDCVIIYKFTPQTAAVSGMVKCEIKLYGADDKLITSPSFLLMVSETVYDEGVEVESEKEVGALTHLISEATTVITEGNKVNAESKDLIQELKDNREELQQNIAETEEYANSAHSSAQAAQASQQAAAGSATSAATSAGNAAASENATKRSETIALGAAVDAKLQKDEAAASAAAAKASAEEAKQHADTIDTEQIDSKIAAKADDLYFDKGTSLLYLVSNGEIIGTGVQVATTGGGSGGTLSYTISMKNLLDSRVITVSDGWLMDEDDNTVLRVTGDARLNIPYRMFAYDFRTTGKTIEFELATREVLNYDAEVINCFSGGRGFSITAQQLKLTSEQSTLGTRYKEDEHIRVTFVAEKKSENRLLLCYINGIMSGAAQYPTDDDFSQADPVGITIGSNDCTTDLYNIRVYDNNLTRHQVLDNWIADTQNPEERIARYLRNNIYDAYGRVTISQLPTDLPYMVLQSAELPQFKGDKKDCSGYFVDPANSNRNFTFTSAQNDVQGTSSQYYYVKNFKIKFKGGFILYDGSSVTVYQMNENAVPVATFTMKADVASSEGAFNVVLAMLYNDLCPFKTPAQEADPRIRQTIEGFPIVIFWDNGSEIKFIGKYNFNNDKGTAEVFGFQEGDESWEILQNGTDRVGWHSADFSGSDWKNDFEARFPEDNTDTTRLQALAEWLVSTDTDQATGEAITPVTYDGVEYTTDTAEYRLAKFSAELADHFVEEAVIYYYLFTDVFLCIDQREKNAFPTYIASLDRWIVLFYDADSSIGTDNKGNLAFDYWLEDIDYTEAGDPIFNGQNSVLWKNLRQTRSAEIKAMYQEMRTSGALSYDAAIGRFEAHQSKWPEAIFNEDMQRKCLEPLIETGDGLYIPMLQGKKEQWMKWWLYNRFRYMDSKHETGSSMENRITIRAHQKANIFLTAYANIVGHVYFNAAMVEHRMERNQEYEFEWPASGAEDPVIGINDADLLTSLGDLSPHMVELIDVSGAPHITSLKLGDAAEDYTNYDLNSVTLGNNILLRTLDMRNCVNLTQAIDASGCTNIEEIYLDGTSVTGLTLPNGGILKVLHLPETVTNLTIRNQKALTEFVIPSYANISTLRLENNSDVIDPFAILNAMPNNGRVRIVGFDLEMTNGELNAFLTKLDSMRGLDENGNNTDLAQVSGRVYVEEINGTTLGKAEKYVGLTVEYGEVVMYATRLVERTLSGDYTNDRVTSVGAYAFCGLTLGRVTLSNVAGKTPNDVRPFGGLKADELNLPLVTESGYWMLQSSTIGVLRLPSLTNLYNQSLWASSINRVVLNSLETIGNVLGAKMIAETFDCHKLTTLYNWPAYGYWGARLTNLIIRTPTVCTLSNTPATTTGTLYVPASLVDSYKAATNWSDMADRIFAIEDYPDICEVS